MAQPVASRPNVVAVRRGWRCRSPTRARTPPRAKVEAEDKSREDGRQGGRSRLSSFRRENGERRMSESVKETKAQRAERLKGQLNPWSAYAEIERFAREGWDAIPPEWLNTYFRWWGIYTQGDGVGAMGGGGAEGKGDGIRSGGVRLPKAPF